MRWLRRTQLGSEADRATFRALHNASMASPALRGGLNRSAAERSIKHLHAVLGTPALALTNLTSLLAWHGPKSDHSVRTPALAARALDKGATRVLGPDEVCKPTCLDAGCEVRHAIVSPLVIDEVMVGTLQVFTPYPTAGLVRAAEELSGWVSGQLELAELDASRTRLMEAEVRALRAQISPHFIYNSLGAIASFVRTDPDRARDLLLEFADFTRYALRKGGAFTTLADELRNVERYLVLEQARFGERLQVSLLIAPEVLAVTVPYLAIQPLVENAVRHGLAHSERPGTVSITAADRGGEAEIVVEDDGVGADPRRIQAVLDGTHESDSHGLGNVDARLRTIYGDEMGLVVDTAKGAGMRVSFRVPKFLPAAHGAADHLP